MGSGPPGWAGEPAVFHVVVGLDRGHACVPALPHNMVAGSVKAMMCTLTSVTVTPAPVSHINFFLLLQLDFTNALSKINKYILYICILSVKTSRLYLGFFKVTYLFFWLISSFSVFDILTFFLSVSGNWGPWSNWGSCSKTCNGGQMRRYRTCDNPRPANGGRACAGADTQIQRCSTATCPGESACLRITGVNKA